MDMKALNVQQRTFGIIENGTWACKSGSLIRDFLENEMRDITVLDEKLTLNSALNEDSLLDLEALADGLIGSMK